MDPFRTHQADILDPAQQPRVIALLREHGLVTFTGITSRAALADVARRLMNIRPHRDAGPDRVTVITDIGTTDPGYAAFTDAELIPHTDGTSLPDPPGLLLLACQRAASQGGNTLLADAACITATLAEQHPAAFQALSAPRAAYFGTADGYLGPVCEPAGPGRVRIRLRLDDLAMFSADATPSSRCCAPSSPSTSTPSRSAPAKACWSATLAGCTAAITTSALASCSASWATLSPTPASSPDSPHLRTARRQHRQHDNLFRTPRPRVGEPPPGREHRNCCYVRPCIKP